MGARGKPCPACDPQLRSQVDSRLEAEQSYGEIASALGLSKHTIGRHARHSAQPVAAETDNLTPLEASEKRLTTLAERCEAQWLSAASSGDGRTALDVLKTAVRLEVDRHARLLETREKQAAAEADDAANPASGAPSIRWLDGLVRRSREVTAQALANGKIKCPCCDGFNFVDPSTILEKLPAIEAAALAAKSEGVRPNGNVSTDTIWR
jgi:hypothetical protein